MFAYMNPGVGAFMIQAILIGVAGVVACLRGFRSRIRGLAQEAAALCRFFSRANRPWRTVVFYSERAAYHPYLEGLLDALRATAGIPMSYLTSDAQDPILRDPPDRVRAFCFKTLLPFVIVWLDAKVLVMTMPDLHRFHIRRSVRGAHHVYVFHAMVSTHMVYRRGAFDHYDTIFCVGPHQLAELRRAEALDHRPAKRLLEVGYGRLERIYEEHRMLLDRPIRREGTQGCVLVAPSWGDGNILESCIRELVAALAGAGYQVVVRPHPEFRKRKPQLMDRLSRDVAAQGRASIEPEPLSDRSIHDADVLITDWSGIALEYAFGTERPVVFIDVPAKVRNPDYGRWGIVPVEVALRSEIGIVLQPGAIGQLAEAVEHLMEHRADYRARIQQHRSRYVYNFGRASEVGAEAIADLCR